MTTTTGPSSPARRLDGTAIDRVLSEAVASGGVPHVAAIVADREGSSTRGPPARGPWARTSRSPSTRASGSCR
jgi:hypothetical protein